MVSIILYYVNTVILLMVLIWCQHYTDVCINIQIHNCITSLSCIRWVDAGKFLTGFSAVGSVAVPAILYHAEVCAVSGCVWVCIVHTLTSGIPPVTLNPTPLSFSENQRGSLGNGAGRGSSAGSDCISI